MNVFVTEPTVVKTVSYNIELAENSSFADGSVINLSLLHPKTQMTPITKEITPIRFTDFIMNGKDIQADGTD